MSMVPKASVEFEELMKTLEKDVELAGYSRQNRALAQPPEEDSGLAQPPEEDRGLPQPPEKDRVLPPWRKQKQSKQQDEEDEKPNFCASPMSTDQEDSLEADVEMLLREQSETGVSPFIVRPQSSGRSSNLTQKELKALRVEETLSRIAGKSWQERGPRGDNEVKYWRGQKWRPGSQGGASRFGNRGGRWKEYYASLAKSGQLKSTPGGSKVKNKGENTSKVTTSEGSGKARKTGASSSWEGRR